MQSVTGYSKGKVALLSMGVSCFCLIVFFLIYFVSGLSLGVAVALGVALVVALGILVSVLVDRIVQRNVKVVTDILHAMDDVVVIKDYQGDFVFCNQRTADLYGSTPDEMVGKDDYYFTKNKEQTDKIAKNVQDIMADFKPQTLTEYSTDTNTGETRHFLSTKIPYRDAHNNLKLVVIAKDITDITSMKEEADKDRKRLENVLDVSDEGLWEWNIQTNQVLHNDRWQEIIGISACQETFKEFEACIFPEDLDLVYKALEALVSEGVPYNVEFRMTRPDGKLIWVWDRGRVAEYDENGEVTWIVGIILDITQEKQNQQKIEQLAYYDGLTGLVNRVQLEVELENVVTMSQKQGLYSAILFLDLDRFKLLNDSYGHHMGDILLKMVAERLKTKSKEDLIVSRFGGDEFVIIYPLIGSDQDRATEIVEEYAAELIKEIGRTFSMINKHHDIVIDYDISVSVGGIIFKAGDTESGALLQLADLALYRAKSSTGQKALIYSLDNKDFLTHSSLLLKDMRKSIVDRDFIIFLQPKVDIEGKLTGAEALVRWQHPDCGLLSPAAFMEKAEESNLIVEIGRQVLEQSCEQLRIWQQSANTKDLTLSVNLSAKQIWQSQFVEDFMATVNSYKIDNTKLVVEVTETVLLQDINDAVDKMDKLKAQGISISLDDFGTGYSSLNYLHRLPIDELKIDRSFVNDMEGDEQVRLMVKSIVDLADNFNVRVVAEGVENRAQFEMLKKYDVHIYQGFYFSKPLTINDFHDLSKKQALAANLHVSS